ncbi:MAG: TetR/AcrR family transcriptional regulator [Porticoccaceae bacterium]|nr:TetR/AcrR family transcriptional regulator [Porticoccaceae bacterium]
MSERKLQILQTAIKIIADSGYGSLTMRALARESDIKLGALQYHFRTREVMLRALVAYIAAEYKKKFELVTPDTDSLDIDELLTFLLTDPVEGLFQEDRLWPQLWGMMLVEPLVADLVDDLYREYIQILQKILERSGSTAPRAEAVLIMSMVEGATLFVGKDRPWSDENTTVFELVREFIQDKYKK